MPTQWTTADMPPQAGRIALVTGGNSGIGFETCLALARAGADVILASRNSGRGDAAVARIRAACPGAKVEREALDLDDLGSVRALAERLADRLPKLDLLINNAGGMNAKKRQVTADGLESQLATNFLGHFALTARLQPLLRQAEAPRTVQLSSLAHKRGRIDFADLLAEKRYSPAKAYSQAKLATLMFALELGRRADAAGWNLISAAAHPGWANTNFFVSALGKSWAGRIINLTFPMVAQTEEAGALPTLYAATAPGVVQGGYYGPSKRGETGGPPGPAKMAPQARDAAVAARLWETAERLTGVAFPLS